MKNINDLIRLLKTTKGNLILPVGVPLSGKSTFLSKISEYVIIISRDDILLEMGNGMSYDETFQKVNQKTVNKKLKNTIQEMAKTDENVVIDMTNLVPKRRKGFINSFTNHKKIAVVFPIPDKKELLKRNDKRRIDEGKSLPWDRIQFFIDLYKYPTKDEGFDYIIDMK